MVGNEKATGWFQRTPIQDPEKKNSLPILFPPFNLFISGLPLSYSKNRCGTRYSSLCTARTPPSSGQGHVVVPTKTETRDSNQWEYSSI